jgi:hypothetical protein
MDAGKHCNFSPPPYSRGLQRPLTKPETALSDPSLIFFSRTCTQEPFVPPTCLLFLLCLPFSPALSLSKARVISSSGAKRLASMAHGASIHMPQLIDLKPIDQFTTAQVYQAVQKRFQLMAAPQYPHSCCLALARCVYLLV